MTRIILESKHNKDVQLIKQLAERLNIHYQIQLLPEDEKPTRDRQYYYELIDKGVDVSNYGEPSQWQRKVREDRSIMI